MTDERNMNIRSYYEHRDSMYYSLRKSLTVTIEEFHLFLFNLLVNYWREKVRMFDYNNRLACSLFNATIDDSWIDYRQIFSLTENIYEMVRRLYPSYYISEESHNDESIDNPLYYTEDL